MQPKPTKPPGPSRPPPPPPPAKATPRLGGFRLLQAPAAVALAAVLAVSTPAPAPPQASSSDTLCNLPPTLSGEQGEKKSKIAHPKSAKAARCTSKCVSTCVLGGYGAPGVEGPFNIRRPLVVFKDTFRSRQYCLAECSDVCNLLKDGEDDQ
ncbi:hypothetical protein ACP70R_029573 [Stipagrostis hirtigluma subsp. patula]